MEYVSACHNNTFYILIPKYTDTQNLFSSNHQFFMVPHSRITKKKTHMVSLKSTFDLQLQKIDIITYRTTNKVPLEEGHATSIIKILSVI